MFCRSFLVTTRRCVLINSWSSSIIFINCSIVYKLQWKDKITWTDLSEIRIDICWSFWWIVRFEWIVLDDTDWISRTENGCIWNAHIHVERSWYFSGTCKWFIDPELCFSFASHHTQYGTRSHCFNWDFNLRTMDDPTFLARSISIGLITQHSFSLPGCVSELLYIFLANDAYHEVIELYSQIFDREYCGRFEVPRRSEGKAMPVEGIFPESGLLFGDKAGHHRAIGIKSSFSNAKDKFLL